ncbi:Ig-like domain-containing protein [Wukongibacter sp. M2B1]|uniref:Ig-like domain-containing protein n=1 Tax=Wukongibacter sp. M2B1 TaxID=3088895 RepID=UPI003D7A4278
MKKILVLTMILSIFLCSFSYAQESWIEWKNKTIEDLDKTWTIKFDNILDKSTIQDYYIFIKNIDGNLVNSDLFIKDDGKSVIVDPIDSFKEGEEYYLYISNNVKSEDGKILRKGVKMSFLRILKAKSIVLNKEEVSIEVGSAERLTVAVLPDYVINKKVIWKSENKKITKVSNKGKITVVSSGTTDIIAKGENTEIEERCKVIVIDQIPTVEVDNFDQLFDAIENGYKVDINDDKVKEAYERAEEIINEVMMI